MANASRTNNRQRNTNAKQSITHGIACVAGFLVVSYIGYAMMTDNTILLKEGWKLVETIAYAISGWAIGKSTRR